MEEIDALLEGEASVTADATVTYASSAMMAGTANLSGVLADGISVSIAGDSNLSPQLSILIDVTASGAAVMTAAASLNVAGATTMAGSSSQAADQNLIDANLQGLAVVSSEINESHNAAALLSASSDVVSNINLVAGLTATMAGAATVSASALPVELAATMAGNSGFGVSNFITSIAANMAGAANVAADTRVVRELQASLPGSATITANTHYTQVQLTATLQGGSDLHADPLSLGQWGEDGYGNSPYGSAHPPYGLLSAEALTPTLVRVRYTAMFDGSFTPLFSPFNYAISPAITINSISLESAQSVLLITDPLSEVPYTVTITEARGYFGQPLDPYRSSASFAGVPSTPTFYAVATRNTRVRVVFSDVMLQNSSLTDGGQYQLTDMTGASITISSVETEQASNVRSVVLLLGAALIDERHYQVTTLSGIVTATLLPLNPNTSVFQWVENVLRTQIPIELFSGEVQNGLYGIHGGLVFFSPALQTAAPNSIIQVEEVDVCTRAFDEYHFPEPIDPPVFFTHGGGLVSAPESLLNSTASLWAEFPRLSDARFELVMPAPSPGGPATLTTDVVAPPVDAICDLTLSETWDPSYVSLLNVTNWRLWAPPASGALASIASAVPGFFTLSGVTGMTALSVGQFVIISGSAYAGNNGTFRITAFNSATSVEIANQFGVGPDANNGSILWAKPDPFIVANALAPIPPGPVVKRTYLQFNMHGTAQATETANVLLAAQSTMAGISAAASEGTVL